MSDDQLNIQTDSLFNQNIILNEDDNLFDFPEVITEKTSDDSNLFDFNENVTDTLDIEDESFIQEFLEDTPDNDYNFWRMHPSWDDTLDFPQVFQQEHFNSISDLSIEEQAALGLIDMGEVDRPLGQVQSPLYELSVTQGLRNTAQQALNYSSYISPFWGGDTWWNGFGKGTSPIQLPELQTPEDLGSKTVELVTEYFLPSGMAVTGTKLGSQLLTGAKDIQRLAGKFSRGENIGAFAVGFGAVDMALVDPSAPNLAAFLKDNPKLNGPTQWLVDKLATDPDNTQAMNRFVRLVEGMGIGFTFDSAFWLGKVIANGVSKGTIKAVKPLDQDLFNWMRKNKPEKISTAQYMWGILQEFNPKKWWNQFLFRRADDMHGTKLLMQEADQTKKLVDVDTLESKELLEEFKRIKKANPNLNDDIARAQAHLNLGTKSTAGQSAWAEFKLLKNAGRVIDSFFNSGTLNWRALDASGKEVLDYSKLSKTGIGFTESIAKHIKTETQLEDFMNYLVALRAKKLYNTKLPNGKRKYNGKDILPDFNIKKINEYIEKGNTSPAFKGALKDLQSYNKRLMDFAVDSGVIKREAADAMLKANPVYVPFYRVSESVGTDGTMKLNIKEATTKNPFRNFTGSGGLIQDPYQSLLKNTAVIVDAALRNRANQTLANYLDMVVPIRKKQAEALANQYNLKGNIRRQFIDDYTNKWAEKMDAKDFAGYVKIEKESLKKQLEKAGIKDVNIDDPGIADFIKLMTFSKQNIKFQGQPVLMVMRDGVPEFYKVNDEMIQHVVGEFGYKAYHQMETAIKGLNWYKRWVSSLITKNPGFAFYSNPVRDSFGGAINSTTWGRIPLLDIPVNAWRAFRGMFGKTSIDHKQFEEYINNGGGFGTIYTQNAEQHAYQMQKYFSGKLNVPLNNVITNPKNLWDRYGDMVSTMEHQLRFSEYKRLKKLGYSDRAAAVAAREISVDFSMRGASTVLNHLSQIVPFFNPAIQGAYKSWRTWTKRPAQTFIKTNMYVGAPTAYLWYMNHDNPDYQAYPDWAKRQAWFVPVGSKYDENLKRERTQFILIPKPFDLYGMYANSMEAALYAAHETFTNESNYESASMAIKEFIKASFGNAGHALPPVPMPPALGLGFAVFGNIDTFTHTNIIPKRLEDAPKEHQWTPWSSATMHALGNATGMSPIMLEQVYDSIFPGLGEHFLTLADFFTNVVTDDKYNFEQLPITLEQIPILDRLYEDGIPQISQQELDMFDEVEDGLSEYLSQNQIAELFFADETRIKNWYNSPENKYKIARRPVLFEYLQLVGTINSNIRNTLINKDLSKDSRYRRILKYQHQKRDLANKYLEAIEKSKRLKRF